MRKRRNYVANHAKRGEQDVEDIRNLFRKFVSIKVSEGISDGTVNQYEDNFAFFCEYIDMREIGYDVNSITTDFIRQWATYMQYEHVQFRTIKHRREKQVGLAPSTINTRLKTLRVMFNTLAKERLIDANSMAQIKNVVEPEEEIGILSDRELRRMIGVMDKSFYTTYRDYVLTMLLLDTMMRISEAVQTERSDIDRDAGVIKIRASVAKNRKVRNVPVSDRTIRLLDELMKENDHERYSDYVFAAGDSYYDRHAYNQRLKNYADMAHINKRVYAHLFRHTAATRWLENGGGMEELRLILGHSKYDMVKRYAHVSSKSIVEASRKFSISTNFTDI